MTRTRAISLGLWIVFENGLERVPQRHILRTALGPLGQRRPPLKIGQS